MKITGETLARALSKLIVEVRTHVGSNGEAHLTATQEESGFMSPDDKFQIDTKCRYAKGLNVGEDINKLPFGLYVGRNLLGLPSEVGNSLCIIEITGWQDFKQILVTQMGANKMFFRDVNSGKGWHDSISVNGTLSSGITGTIKAKRIQAFNGTSFEINIDVSMTNISGVQTIGKSPFGFDESIGDFKWYQGLGQDASGGWHPVGIRFSKNGDIAFFKYDSTVITSVKATLTSIQ